MNKLKKLIISLIVWVLVQTSFTISNSRALHEAQCCNIKLRSTWSGPDANRAQDQFENSSVVPAPLISVQGGVTGICNQEPFSVRVDPLPESSASCRDKATSTSSASSCCSVVDLANVTDHYRAAGRLRRESLSQDVGSSGQAPLQLLTQSLTVKLLKLELFPIQDRDSVIYSTPSRQPATSTPSNSPPAPPLPPRQCQSLQLGPILTPRSREHSLSCSELSSIGGEVFGSTEQLDTSADLPFNQQSWQSWSNLLTPSVKLQPPRSIPTPVIQVRVTMEAAEKAVSSKIRKLATKMRGYTPSQVSSGTVEWHKSYSDGIRAAYEDLINSIEDLCEDYSAELTHERLEHWQAQSPNIDRDFQAYVESFKTVLDQIRAAAMSPAIQQSSQGLDSFHSEQIRLMKQQNEIALKNLTDASNETIRETNAKRNQAIKKAQAKKDLILSDIDELSDIVNKVVDWEDEENLSVSRGMRNIAVWRRDLEKITTQFNEFSDIFVTYDLVEDDVEMMSTEVMFRKMTSEFKEAVNGIEKEDDRRELYTLDTAKTDKLSCQYLREEMRKTLPNSSWSWRMDLCRTGFQRQTNFLSLENV